MGFRYTKGLPEAAAQAIVRERSKRPFESIVDLAHRVPELRRKELVLLASIGALIRLVALGKKIYPRILIPRAKLVRGSAASPRRTMGGRARRTFCRPVLESIPENDTASPLVPMTPEERLVADFHGTGLTVGPHPMAYRRAALRRARVLSAQELTQVAHGQMCARLDV